MTELKTVAEVIKALGGTDGVAALTNSKKSAVHMWRFGFPARKYVVMIRALHEMGLYAPPSLWGQDNRPSLDEMAR